MTIDIQYAVSPKSKHLCHLTWCWTCRSIFRYL